MNLKRKNNFFLLMLYKLILCIGCVGHTKYDLNKFPIEKKLMSIFNSICFKDSSIYFGKNEVLLTKTKIDTFIKDRKSNFMGTMPITKYVFKFKEVNDSTRNYIFSIERSPLRKYTTLVVDFYGFYETYENPSEIIENFGSLKSKNKYLSYNYILNSTNDYSYTRSIFINSKEGIIAFTTKNKDTFFLSSSQ